MRYSLWMSFLLTLLVVGCSQEEVQGNEEVSSDGRVFTALFEQNGSRTYLEDGLYSRWTADDRISLFDGNSLNRQYRFDGDTGDNGGTFSVVEKPYGTGVPLKANYAVYPYNKDIKITEQGVITATLPSLQQYAENSYGLGSNTMVAVTQDTDDTFLSFRNVGGCLKLQLYGDNVMIKSIVLKGNNGEKIAGKASITQAYGNPVLVNMANEATGSITLDCGKGGIHIGTSANVATSFWFVLPPTTFTKGITITVMDVNGGEFIQTTSKEISIERNVVKPMAAVEVKPQAAIPYLTFKADAEQTLTMSKEVETLEYSVGGETWKTLGTNKVVFGGDLGNLRLRGKSVWGTAIDMFDDYSTILFDEEIPVVCSGDIRTLLDYEHFNTVNTKDARFCKLFYKNKSIVSAPELPAIILADDCYNAMFANCVNLLQTPELPATVLSENCYRGMFSGCKSLRTVSVLPAFKLASYCYAGMYSGCTNLLQAPELPATDLAQKCYNFMFMGCESLKRAPKLPAMTLAESCYGGMFWGCLSLSQAPELPATTLAPYCYNTMFDMCTSLIEAPALPATILAKGCYHAMFAWCSGLEKAPELPSVTLADECYKSMFTHCSSLLYAPELPATTLKSHCYFQMFNGCKSLKQAPALPAKTLTNYCYQGMFQSCESLTQAPALPAAVLTEYCYEYMFSGCKNLIQAPELPATTLAPHCYAGMFSLCESLVQAPKLPASTLSDYCYYSMFWSCKKLTKAPLLHAAVLVDHCYEQMFGYCPRLSAITMLAIDIGATDCLKFWTYSLPASGTFTKAMGMTSLPIGENGIPKGWTIINR